MGINLADLNGKNFSITTKITLTLCLLFLIVSFVIGSSFFLRQQALIYEEFKSKGQNIAHSVAVLVVDYVLLEDYQSINDMFQKLKNYGNIKYILITDTTGRVLAHSYAGASFNNEDILNISSNSNEFTAPITHFGRGTIGYVRLGLNSEHLNNYPIYLVENWFLFALTAVLAGIILTAIVTKRTLQKPFAELANATELFSAGDFSSQINTSYGGEIGSIANSLNTTSFHLGNLVQQVKNSTTDIQKGMEQLYNLLETTGQSNNRFVQNVIVFKDKLHEKINSLENLSSLAKQVSKQINRIEERQNINLVLTNQALQAGEKKAGNISTIALNLKNCYDELLECNRLQATLLDKERNWSQSINNMISVFEQLSPFTVEVALEAAKSGNKELTNTAENLNQALQETQNYFKEFKLQFITLLDTCKAAQQAMEKSLSQVKAVENEFTVPHSFLAELEKVLKEKRELENEINSEMEELNNSIMTLIQDVSNNISNLDKFVQSNINSHSELQSADLREVGTLVKKLLRQTDRLNTLASQYKI